MKQLVIILSFLCAFTVQAQLVDVNDVNLQNYLCTNAPGAMVNSCTQIDLSQRTLINDTLNIDNQNITDISPILELDHIIWFEADDNGITNLNGDFSKMTSLRSLDLSFNNFSDFPDFSTISSPNFNILTITNNGTIGEGWPDLSTVSSTLTDLYIAWDNLDSIDYDIMNYPNLTTVHLNGNKYTFKDFISLIPDPNFSTKYRLFPQREVPCDLPDTTKTAPGNTFVMELEITGPDPNNVYNWYRGSDLIETTNEPRLTLYNVSTLDNGSYRAVVSNTLPSFSGVGDTLTSVTKHLLVKTSGLDCSSITFATPTLTTKCTSHSIQLSGNTIDSLSYQLLGVDNSATYNSSGTTFQNIPNGDYELVITSSAGCSVYMENLVPVTNDDNCENVISPNGDGVGDSFYLEQEGAIRILSQSGQLIKSIKGPAFWDGTNTNGELVDAGYYLIVIGDTEQLNITVER